MSDFLSGIIETGNVLASLKVKGENIPVNP